MYYFLTPKGHVINKVGVSPDFVVENYKEVDAAALTERYKSFAPMNEKNKPKAGDTGLNVYGAQQRLSLLGYEVTVTGVMDDKTVAAVKAIQKNQGLYVYGVLDYATMKAIDQETIKYINGADTDKDLQLEKAIQLLMK
jgi:carboxyl-terminal processing protease